LASFDVGQIDAVEQHGQLGGPNHQTMATHRGPLLVRWGKDEGAFFETLVLNGEAVAVPVQQFEAIAALAAKNEQVASERILAELLFD
jgi:hypothetical protein